MKRLLQLILPLLLTLCCCHNSYDGATERCMYYWSTTFDLDSAKLRFIADHGITRLYVRYFDVVLDDKGFPKPNATIAFGSDSLPDVSERLPKGIEIIPVVYILNDCMAANVTTPDSELAENLLRRILQMNETHGLGKVREIQIDCDWTASTRKRLFSFLTELKSRATKQQIAISATIRLHQLSQPAPPVDKGILMVYNTGDMQDFRCTKPILDPEVVQQYVRYLKDYKLPLGAAYPIYKWDLLFRNGKFVDIQHYQGELPVMPGDTLVTRVPSAEDILSAKKIIESARPDCRRETILFDLNQYNINRFSHDRIESFFD